MIPEASWLLAVVAILLATKVLGKLAQRIGQPAVLGELIAGILLGGSVLGVVNPADPVISTLSELGVVILLFAIGLETEVAAIVRVGGAAMTVAVAGVVLPFGLGYASAIGLGLSTTSALVCGAALCATSIGITARVLSELGWLESSEGRVILGAAVIDDVLGLIILAMVASVVGGTASTHGAGSVMIVGAFAAGLVLYKLPKRHEVEKAVTSIGHVFVPVFFATVGAAVDLRALGNAQSLLLGAALIGCGVVGKVAAGFAPWWFRGDKLFVGLGMMPRGEVGLIFAQMGLAAGAVSAGEFGALMLMVLATTFVTPPALVWRARRHGKKTPSSDRPGEGGIDDLVAGV